MEDVRMISMLALKTLIIIGRDTLTFLSCLSKNILFLFLDFACDAPLALEHIHNSRAQKSERFNSAYSSAGNRQSWLW